MTPTPSLTLLERRRAATQEELEAIAHGVAHTFDAAVQTGGAERHVPELAAVLAQRKAS